MKLVSWNINSVRLRLPLLLRLMREEAPDVICLQETKATDDVFPNEPIKAAGYQHILKRGMKGYNGVAILSRLPLVPLPALNWAGRDDCRHIAAQLPCGTALHNFYIPAGGDIPDPKENDKFAHKLQFLKELAEWGEEQKKSQPQILVGDLNIAPLPDDVWSHKQLLDVVSHTPVEVAALAKVQGALGWVDALRHLYPAPEKLYSWWSYRSADWQASNRGRRLDHIWLTPDVLPRLKAATILTAARSWPQPSDHVPVIVTLAPAAKAAAKRTK